jgi:predicted transcriptional regulator
MSKSGKPKSQPDKPKSQPSKPKRQPVAPSKLILSLQEVDLMIIEHLTKNPESLTFVARKGLGEELGISKTVLSTHIGRLKKYGIIKGIVVLTEEG